MIGNRYIFCHAKNEEAQLQPQSIGQRLIHLNARQFVPQTFRVFSEKTSCNVKLLEYNWMLEGALIIIHTPPLISMTAALKFSLPIIGSLSSKLDKYDNHPHALIKL